MELWATSLLFAVALLTAMAPTHAETLNYNQNERIRKKVLENYDKMALPHRDQNGTTNVRFDVTINGFWIEEDKQIFNLNAWVPMVWDDPRLTWDYKNYGGVSSLHLAESEAWVPDITLYNNADGYNVNHYGKVHLLVSSEGSVLWVPPATFRSECPLDFTYWPYDKQKCTMTFGSWTAHGWQIRLTQMINRTEPSIGWFLKYSHKWQYVGGTVRTISKVYSCCPEPYYSIELEVNLQRISPTYASTVIVPAVVISLLTLLQFLLPLREKQRITIGLASVLLTLLALFYIARSVPSLAYSAPIIVKFYGQTLVVVLLSLGVSAVILRLVDAQHPEASTPPPALLKTVLTGPLGSLMLLRKYMDKVGHSGSGDADAEVLEDVRPVSYAHEWLLVAAAVDRLAALAFAATFVFTLIAYTAAL